MAIRLNHYPAGLAAVSFLLIAVFPKGCPSSDLTERLSRITDIPITLDDGLSHRICRLCNRKFLSAESFIVLAKASYEKTSTHAGLSQVSLAAQRVLGSKKDIQRH